MKLSALTEGRELGLDCIGTLCPIEDASSVAVSLYKHVQVRNIGSYNKQMLTPMYHKQVMIDHMARRSGFRFDPAGCLGVLCNGMSCPPDAYVTRASGPHHFFLPVYRPAKLSGAFYRVAGYMLTDSGYIAVARRRWLLWSSLAMLGGTAFVLGYLVLVYGSEGAMSELLHFWRNLF